MIDYSKIRVLLADGGDRQTLPMAKAFKKLGCSVTTFNCSKLDNGYVTRYADHKILEKRAKDDLDFFITVLEKHLKSEKFDLVITTSDLTAEALSLNKKRLEQYTKVAVVEPDLFYIAYDKLNTMRICMENGIPCPKTLVDIKTIQDVISADLVYPVVIKPRKSYGAIGYKKVDNQDELVNFLSKPDCDITSLVIQEYIPQTDVQYDAIMFADNEYNIKTSMVLSKNRWYPVDGGASTCNVTADKPDIAESCSKLLTTIGWRGCADIDLIQDPRDGIAKVIEINPRISANIKISFYAGVNMAQQILELSFGDTVTPFVEYKKDVRMRCIHTDLLWFLKSKNRFCSQPSWFSFRHTHDQIFSITDPLPFFTFTIQVIGKFRREIAKRAH